MIRSKFAEIIMWASPAWEVDPATNLLQVATHANGGMPLYRDTNNDLIPDRILLHQRTLLIRPDLNASRSISNGGANAFNSNVLRPWNAATNPMSIPAPLERLYPIGINNNGTAPFYPNYAVPNSANDNRDMLTSNWLVGMAPLHHFFDLSLRRVIDPETGVPTGYVAANSMADLVQPHNRFAAVRYPGRYFGRGTFGGGDDATSMPLLALGWNDPVLRWQGVSDTRAIPGVATAPAWFPIGQPSPLTLNNAGGTPSRTGLFNGWLLPMFELGDPNPPGTSRGEHWEREYLTVADSRWDRTGEDVLTSNVLSFDVRAFDATAPVFLATGPDGQPGKAGIDDDFSGSVDETDLAGTTARIEFGAAGSDDVLLGVNDIGVFDVMGQPILDPRRPSTYYNSGTGAVIPGLKIALGSQGAFVDLAYPMLAGSPLRQRFAESLIAGQVSSPPLTAVTPVARVATNFNLHMHSTLSGTPLIQPSTTAGMNSLKRSGKLVHSATNGAICFFQPTYDTWTDGYESDGFDQTHTQAGEVRGANLMGTTWVINNPSNAGIAPVPRLIAPAPRNLIQVDTGRWVPGEPETSAPFPTPLEAISITVRVLDPSNNEMSQFSVVESLK